MHYSNVLGNIGKSQYSVLKFYLALRNFASRVFKTVS